MITDQSETRSNNNYISNIDDNFPELTEADFASARRWRPGDPVQTLPVDATPADRLRHMARMLRAQADALDAEADRLPEPAH